MIKRKLLIIELNEFNRDLLSEAVALYEFENINKLLGMRHSTTHTLDDKEFHGLDPWVQWVSVHTGIDSTNHKVSRFGEVPKLETPQFWEILGKNSLSTGIWGAMNASLNNTENNKFFFPDPWTFSESANPIELNRFLELPRYYAKNYISPSKLQIFKALLNNIRFLLLKPFIKPFAKELIRSINTILSNGLSDNVLFCLFDIYSTIIFLIYKNLYNPDCSLIFLNSLAHHQHSHWGKNKINKRMKQCLFNIDRILGLLMKSRKENEAILVLNALGQKNVEGEGMCIYRQVNPNNFLKSFGLEFLRIEQGMTNDGYVFFKTEKDLEITYSALKEAWFDNQPMFYVKKEIINSNKLFYQFDFHKRVNKNATFYLNGKEAFFQKHFKLLGLNERTGSHTPVGDIFSDSISFPKELANHEIKSHILAYFGIR